MCLPNQAANVILYMNTISPVITEVRHHGLTKFSVL